MINLTQKTVYEINNDMAARLAALRKRKKLSRKELASKSGVSYASLRRFEETGEISLKSLTLISIALGVSQQMDSLFANVPFGSIEEVLNERGK